MHSKIFSMIKVPCLREIKITYFFLTMHHPCTDPCTDVKHSPACLSTPTPIRPHRTDRHQLYIILQLPFFKQTLFLNRLGDELRKMVLFDGMTSTTTTSATTATATTTTATITTTTNSNGLSSRPLTKNSYSIYIQTLGSVHAVLILSKPCSEIEDPFLRHLWNIGIVKLPEIEQGHRSLFPLSH